MDNSEKEDKSTELSIIEVIMTTKNMRKKGNKLEIETPEHYLLCKMEGDVLWVINAKQK